MFNFTHIPVHAFEEFVRLNLVEPVGSYAHW